MIKCLVTGLFGTEVRSGSLLVIGLLGESHASEIARILNRAVSRVQAALVSLEEAGVIVSSFQGNTRRVRLNPRLPVLDELRALLNKLGMVDGPLQQKLAEERRRPRRRGKPL